MSGFRKGDVCQICCTMYLLDNWYICKQIYCVMLVDLSNAFDSLVRHIDWLSLSSRYNMTYARYVKMHKGRPFVKRPRRPGSSTHTSMCATNDSFVRTSWHSLCLTRWWILIKYQDRSSSYLDMCMHISWLENVQSVHTLYHILRPCGLWGYSQRSIIS